MDMTQPGLGKPHHAPGENVTVGQGHQNVIPLNNDPYCTLVVTQGQIVRWATLWNCSMRAMMRNCNQSVT